MSKHFNETHGMRKTRLYRIWRKMKDRCYYENENNYKYYGGRGIKVCDEWNAKFEPFMKWAFENDYADNLVIDRIDNDGNYEPLNCQWITNNENVAIGKRRMHQNNKSSYEGVSYQKRYKKYIACIFINGKNKTLGRFDDPLDAAICRIKSEYKYFGEQRTNLRVVYKHAE